jgi:hypothetical protein
MNLALYLSRVRSSDLLDGTTYIPRSTRLNATHAASPHRAELNENSTAPTRSPTAAEAPLVSIQNPTAAPSSPPTMAPDTANIFRRVRNSGSADIDRIATRPLDPFARVRTSHSTISPRLNCTGSLLPPSTTRRRRRGGRIYGGASCAV